MAYSAPATANRIYLGSGKAVVDNATMTLGNVGATSNSSGDDYTAINGGRIQIASGTAGVVPPFLQYRRKQHHRRWFRFGQGLASLTRGTNVTLASGAIIGHNALTAALNTTTGTIQNPRHGCRPVLRSQCRPEQCQWQHQHRQRHGVQGHQHRSLLQELGSRVPSTLLRVRRASISRDTQRMERP
jgi:hypothetical protein